MMPSKESIISYLDFEFHRLQSETQKPGWTLWGLFGGIATLLWLILKEIEFHPFGNNQLLKFIILGFFAKEIIEYLIFFSGLESQKDFINKNKYTFSKTHFSSNRMLLFVEVLQTVILLLLINKCDLSVLTNISINIYLWSRLILSILAITLCYIELPMRLSDERDKKFSIGGSWILLIFSLIVIALLTSEIEVKEFSEIIPEIRIAGMITLCVYLISLSTKVNHKNYFIKNICDLRKLVSLDQITEEKAINQIEIIFSGMELESVFQKEILENLNILNNINNAIISIKHKMEFIKENSKRELTEGEKTSLIAVQDSIRHDYDEIEKSFDICEKMNKDLYNRVSRVTSSSPNQDLEIENLFSNFKIAMNEITRNLKDIAPSDITQEMIE